MSDICDCGHDRSEHDREYSWAPGRRYCSGHVIAYPRDAERTEDGRPTYCQCSSFTAASDYQLQEWRNAGLLIP